MTRCVFVAVVGFLSSFSSSIVHSEPTSDATLTVSFDNESTRASVPQPIWLNQQYDFHHSSWGDATASTEPFRGDAGAALRAGRYATAAEMYRRIAAMIPTCPASADSWFMAAISNGRLGRPQEASADCSRAIADCRRLLVVDEYNPPRNENRLPHLPSIKDIMYRAMRYKAEQCALNGDNAEAIATIEELRAEALEYPVFRRVLPLQARIQGVDADALDQQEAASWQMADRAKWAWGEGDADSAIRLADSIIETYPSTAAAILAQRCKARVLWRLKDFDEARHCYQRLLQRVGSVAPTCETAREAEAKIAYLEMVPQIRSLIRKSHGISPVPIDPEEWEQVRSTCRISMSQDTTPVVRAVAHGVFIESLHFEGQHEKLLKEVNHFLDLHDRAQSMDDREYRTQILWVKYYAGWAQLQLGKIIEGTEQFRDVINAYENAPDRWGRESALPHAYFGLWKSLVGAGVSAEEARAEVAPLLTNYPRGSRYVRTIEASQ